MTTFQDTMARIMAMSSQLGNTLERNKVRQKQQQEEADSQLLMMALKGVPVSVLEVTAPDAATPRGFKRAVELSKYVSKKQKESQVLDPGNVTESALPLVPTVGEGGKLGPSLLQTQRAQAQQAGTVQPPMEGEGLMRRGRGMGLDINTPEGRSAMGQYIASVTQKRDAMLAQIRQNAADEQRQSDIGENAQIRGENRAESRLKRTVGLRTAEAGRAEFVENASSVLATLPNLGSRSRQREEFRRLAETQFGIEGAHTVMAQIETGAVAKRARDTGQSELEAFIADGASPRLAALAVKDKAFKDPLTGLYAAGSSGGARATSAGARMGLMQILADMNVTAQRFAEEGGGSAFTGIFQRVVSQVGTEQSALFAQYEVFSSQFDLLLAVARSGKQLNEREVVLLEKAKPTLAQIKVRDGKFAPESQARFDALFRLMENEHLSLFDTSTRYTARARMRAERRAMLEESRRSPDLQNSRADKVNVPAMGTADLEAAERAAGIRRSP